MRTCVQHITNTGMERSIMGLEFDSIVVGATEGAGLRCPVVEGGARLTRRDKGGDGTGGLWR